MLSCSVSYVNKLYQIVKPKKLQLKIWVVANQVSFCIPFTWIYTFKMYTLNKLYFLERI